MKIDFIGAISQLADEKNIPKEIIFEALEAALAAAYRKDYGKSNQTIKVNLDRETGSMRVFLAKSVVEEVSDETIEINLKDAKKINPDAEIEDEVLIELEPAENYGRIAAQTAKQVVIQRLREAEREMVFNEYKNRENTLINGTVQQIEGSNIIIDLGRANAIMFPSEQPVGERYHIGQRLKVFLVAVDQTTKGPQLIVSRAHPNMIKELFALEVPEIGSGSVEIKNVAREAGMRSKVAVSARQEGVDPVGSCVGQRGTRVQAVLSEIGQEKIDIVLWNEDPRVFITNAFSPAKVLRVDLNETAKEATVYTESDQLSLAIGKSGQNVRLAAKLTGWKIDVIEATEEIKNKIMKNSDVDKKVKEDSKNTSPDLEIKESNKEPLNDTKNQSEDSEKEIIVDEQSNTDQAESTDENDS